MTESQLLRAWRGGKLNDVIHSRKGAMVVLSESPFTLSSLPDGAEDGDIHVRGWLTTTALNSYRQIVHTSTFDWDGGLKFWQGRILNNHGRQFLMGGGDNVPIGRISQLDTITDEGYYGEGYIYHESNPQLRRAMRDGTVNSFSIGFMVEEGGAEYDEDDDIVHITKGRLHEVSVVNVGANELSKFKVLNDVTLSSMTNNAEYYILIKGGKRYLVNRTKGDVIQC